MDEEGYFNFGPTSFWQRAVIERTDRYGISGNLGGISGTDGTFPKLRRRPEGVFRLRPETSRLSPPSSVQFQMLARSIARLRSGSGCASRFTSSGVERGDKKFQEGFVGERVLT